jgi:hypothetical protein
MRRKPRGPSAGTLIGTLALVFAVTGAAVALPGKDTVNSGDIKNKQVKAADIGKPKVRNLTLINNWGPDASPCNTPRVVKDVAGNVRLEGCVDRSAGTSTEPFVMPVGFRPAARTFLPVDIDGTTHGRLVLNADGQVDLFDAGTGNSADFTSLEGATWRAK